MMRHFPLDSPTSIIRPAMSLISRLFGKSPAPAAEPVAAPPADRAPSPPRPDPALRAREEEESLSQAIEAGDRVAVGRWVLEGHSTHVRQRAAEAITDPEQLRELIRATRGGNDKSVYRILTTKRDELLAAERREREIRTAVDEAAAALARHAERAHDGAYAGTLERLEARWLAVAADASDELRREVTRHVERARETIENHRKAAEAEKERQRAAALAAEEARQQREAEAQAAAAAAAERAQALEAERAAERAKREAEDAVVRDLVGLLRQAQSAVDHGGTARAARLRDAIKSKLPEAPPLPVWFATKLEQVDARIQELQDWKTFTVVPKRAELLQQMQSLVDADLSPEERAQWIRRLRDEWRTLSRGGGEEPTPEWQAFEDAAERAYEPCREHFAKQAEQRKENQAKREALLERLTAFAAEQAGEQPNWRAVQQAVVESRREWREYAPVDQSVVKSLQERFHAIVGDLQKRLDDEYARNIEAKRALIERTAKLVELEDTRQAIDEAKRLQGEWRTVGIVPRHKDNALWEEFRKHCDVVFHRSARESEARGHALDANQGRAEALAEELGRLADLQDAALADAVKRADEIVAEFDALELPRGSARELRQRFARAADRFGEAVRRHRAAAAERGWTDAFAAAAHVRAWALAVANGRPPADCEALKSAAAEAVAGLENAPKSARATLEQQLGRVERGAIETDLAANEAALRLLCIRAELVAGLESPPEDQELRREHQMQRLVASMGRGERATPVDVDGLALEWLAVGPVEATAHETLFARFERCRPT
jgi:hypothetical protein